MNAFSSIEPFDKSIDSNGLLTAMTAYFNVWNMTCPDCTTRLRNGLLKREAVLIADVFFKQGVAAVTYDPASLTVEDLLKTITAIGQEIDHYYGAELIGHEPATQALHL